MYEGRDGQRHHRPDFFDEMKEGPLPLLSKIAAGRPDLSAL